jgi:hypothetical protein
MPGAIRSERSEQSNSGSRAAVLSPGWRAAVLDVGASRHVFRLRVTEEGSGSRAPASASGASNALRSEPTRFWLACDDEVGGIPGAIRSERSEQSNNVRRASSSITLHRWNFSEKSARVVEETDFAAYCL